MTTGSISKNYMVAISVIVYYVAAVQVIQDIFEDDLSNTTSLLRPGLRSGRWGVFFSYEPICTKACVQNGKYGGRMYGGICRCYCVRNDPSPCKGAYPSCDRLCKLNFYPLGGDCVDGKLCYCTCSVRQDQSPNGTLSTTTAAPCASIPGHSGAGGPPSGGGAPSPGLLGLSSQEGASGTGAGSGSSVGSASSSGTGSNAPSRALYSHL